MKLEELGFKLCESTYRPYLHFSVNIVRLPIPHIWNQTGIDNTVFSWCETPYTEHWTFSSGCTRLTTRHDYTRILVTTGVLEPIPGPTVVPCTGPTHRWEILKPGLTLRHSNPRANDISIFATKHQIKHLFQIVCRKIQLIFSICAIYNQQMDLLKDN